MLTSVGMSQIRNYGNERSQEKTQKTDHEARLRQGMKEYKETKTPEAKAKIRSIWTMAAMGGVNIDPKLNEQVKKLLREPDVKPTGGGGGAGAGAPGGSGPGPEMGNLLGGLAQNFPPPAEGGDAPAGGGEGAQADAGIQDGGGSAQADAGSEIQDGGQGAQADSGSAIQDGGEDAQADSGSAIRDGGEGAQANSGSAIQDGGGGAQADAGSAIQDGGESAQADAGSGIQDGGEGAQADAGSGSQNGGADAGSANQDEGVGAQAAGEQEAAQGNSAIKKPGAYGETPTDSDKTRPVDETKKKDAADPVKDQFNPNDPFGPSRTALTNSFRDSKVLDDQSMERLGRMMTAFEDRMAGLAMTKIDAYRQANGSITPEKAQEILAEQRQKIEDCYKHLTEMVGTKQGANELFNQADRTSMSENLLFHLADPRTFDQGSNGTCWINSSTSSYGLTTQPDDMARFMKEISLTGQFNAHPDGQGNGARTVNFNKNMFYATGEEQRWKISSALGGSARSPVGMFMDEAMTEMVGKHRADAGDYYGSWGAKRIMTMISGEAPPEPRGRLWNASTNRQMGQGDMQTMLAHGGFQTYSPGHLQSVQFVPEHKTGWNGANGLTYNGQNLKLDGTDKYSGFVVLDNQWGERSDFVTHYMNDNKQVMDIQDQRYQHFDPGKVTNERQITIRPGNDSNGGGGGGGDWDGGGLVPILPSVLDNVISGGGIADKSDLTTPGGWQSLLKSLTVLAEKEVARGRPGKNYQLLKKVVGETKVAEVLDAGTMKRMKKVLQKGRMLETRFSPLPRPRIPRPI